MRALLKGLLSAVRGRRKRLPPELSLHRDLSQELGVLRPLLLEPGMGRLLYSTLGQVRNLENVEE